MSNEFSIKKNYMGHYIMYLSKEFSKTFKKNYMRVMN